jgi:uncharacterized membrane protein
MLPKIPDPVKKPIIHAGSNPVPFALVMAMILTISWIAWLTQVDQFQRQEHFSEFYLQDSALLFQTNSLELLENQESRVNVAIVNHEGTKSNYRIHILINGQLLSIVDKVSLEDNGSSEEEINFSFPGAGDNQRVDLLLEKQGASFPYRSLHFLANVSSKGKDAP